jgi:predicted Zn-dependent protease
VTNATAYLDRVDGLAYGADPRQGYFDGDTFYHPELAFEISLPQGWERRNTTAAVTARSPDGTAAMQLTLAREPELAAAQSALRSEPGYRETASSRARIRGNPALVTQFAIASAQGAVIEGLAAHLEYEGRIYRILVYARAGAFGQHEATAERLIESFAAVDDRDILDVRPPRLNIVAIDREMSLLDFSERYPSVVPIEEVAIINQVEGPASRLAPDAEVKQVTS